MIAYNSLFIVPVLDGISWAVMLILLSIGLTLTFGFLEVVNFAHGAFYMLGGYILFSAVELTGSFWLGLFAGPVIVLILGILTEWITLRPTYDFGPITQLLVLLGITFVIEGGVIIIWSGTMKTVNQPELLAGSIKILGSPYPLYRLFLIVVGTVFIMAVWIFLNFSRVGLVIRASLTDKTMARALGNDIPSIYTLVFAGGVAIAAMAGALMTPIRSVGPTTGATALLLAFIVVVTGGLGSFRGSILAGFGIGILDVLVARFVSFRLSGITVFILMVIVLIIRPRGLLGKEGVMTE